MDNKKIESPGIEVIEKWIRDTIGGKDIKIQPNKGRSAKSDLLFGADICFKYNGEDWYVDVKASNKKYDGNIRITYQTIYKLREADRLNRFLIAIVDNTGTDEQCIRLFHFSDFSSILGVEPHFIFQQKKVREFLKGEDNSESAKGWLDRKNNYGRDLSYFEGSFKKTVEEIIKEKYKK